MAGVLLRARRTSAGLDPALVAAGFAAFGEHVLVIRLVQTLLFALTVFTGTLLSWRLLHSRLAAVATGLLLAVPTVNVMLLHDGLDRRLRRSAAAGPDPAADHAGDPGPPAPVAVRRMGPGGRHRLLDLRADACLHPSRTCLLAWRVARRTPRLAALAGWPLAFAGVLVGMAPWVTWAISIRPER